MLKNTLRSFGSGPNGDKLFCSLPALEELGYGEVSRLPFSLRIVLESLARNAGDGAVSEEDVRALAGWKPAGKRVREIPFFVSRVLLQDFTGVPLLVDLAAMRSEIARRGGDPSAVEPCVPVDLVVDHSLQVDHSGRPDAMERNMELELSRNLERYSFLKWGQAAFKTFKVVPPGTGIIHQVNLERLARLVFNTPAKGGELFFPDTLVGTDSHTTMIGGLGIVGWGVGGIEAEAGMLGQPIGFLTPDVVGVRLKGRLSPGVTATDLVLRVTELLRKQKVVGAFVEFFGDGAAGLRVEDRATVSNMAPEYGATIGCFPVDGRTLEYLRDTGRPEELVEDARLYYEAQGLFGMPDSGRMQYSRVVDLDLSAVRPLVAGPSRPQDAIEVSNLKSRFNALLSRPIAEGGYGKAAAAANVNAGEHKLNHGSVVIASITSCTNTSNTGLMLAAGLLAKKAVERGLTLPWHVKASLAPGSRVVSGYLAKSGLDRPLAKLGFHLVGYGCATCIGNSGPLLAGVEEALRGDDLVAASVLSGNRNFEARVHPAVKANFLASPPLVVAYGLAGRVDIDLETEPVGMGGGLPVFLREIWPSEAEVEDLRRLIGAGLYEEAYGGASGRNVLWDGVASASGALYRWDEKSTYIQEPPFFRDSKPEAAASSGISGMRPLLILGDSVTTDHISPAGSIGKDSPAGRYLVGLGVEPKDFNSYGARRGNDRVMVRGTFANVRLKNLMAGGKEGGFTKLLPESAQMTVFEAAEAYKKRGTPLVIFAGRDYGMGSSRDWAAKGTALLGVRAVAAKSFERIHRSNLVGMGILPLEFSEGAGAAELGFDGSEIFGLDFGKGLRPGGEAVLTVRRQGGKEEKITLRVRIDGEAELACFRSGGILPAMLERLGGKKA